MDRSLTLRGNKHRPRGWLLRLLAVGVVVIGLLFQVPFTPSTAAQESAPSESVTEQAPPSRETGGAGGQEGGASQGGAAGTGATSAGEGGRDTRGGAPGGGDTALYGEDDSGEPGAASTLPPVEPDPGVAPVFERETQEQQPKERVISQRERPGIVLKTLVGLLILLVLAYLGGHSRVLRWEERLGHKYES